MTEKRIDFYDPHAADEIRDALANGEHDAGAGGGGVEIEDPVAKEKRLQAEEEIRKTESYLELKRLYRYGKLDITSLDQAYIHGGTARFSENVFEDKKQPDKPFVNPDKLAAELLIQDIKLGTVKQPKISRGAVKFTATERGYIAKRKIEAEEVAAKLREHTEPWDKMPKNQARIYLCQEYTKGMSIYQMDRQFANNPELKDVYAQFKKDVEDTERPFDPATEIMTRILVRQPGLKKQQQGEGKELTQEDWLNNSDKFLDATRKIWSEFYYSGKWGYDKQKKEYVVMDQTDLDAKTCLFLFKLAKMDGALNKKHLAQGTYKPGGFTVDSSEAVGGVLVKDDGTVELDNHQRGREFETSSAKILYNLLKSANLIRETGPLRGLVEATVADDNAHLITNIKQFDKSSKTLRGLQRFMDAEKLFNFLQGRWVEEGKNFDRSTEGDINRKIYEKILDYEFTPAEMQRLRLDYGSKNQQKTIDSAHKLLFDKTDKDLRAEGRLIDTRWGRCVVNIEGMEERTKSDGSKWFDGMKFKGGHDVVISDPRKLSMYISIDSQNDSILINTTDREVDLSEVFKDLLVEFPQLVSVRGSLIVKPRNGEQFTDKDGKNISGQDFFGKVIKYLTNKDFVAQGQVKQFLENGLSDQVSVKELDPGIKSLIESLPPKDRELHEAEIRKLEIVVREYCLAKLSVSLEWSKMDKVTQDQHLEDLVKEAMLEVRQWYYNKVREEANVKNKKTRTLAHEYPDKDRIEKARQYREK